LIALQENFPSSTECNISETENVERLCVLYHSWTSFDSTTSQERAYSKLYYGLSEVGTFTALGFLWSLSTFEICVNFVINTQFIHKPRLSTI